MCLLNLAHEILYTVFAPMSLPFTIRIYVADGDPEGLRIIDKMNWTGVGIVFPRHKWAEAKKREEFERVGVYVLVGYGDDEDDLPTIYIGQADGVRNRIDSHDQKKEFWDWGIAFVSNNYGLNRAHVTWLEYALVEQAKRVGHCKLENGNAPQEPALTEAEKADTQAFFKEILHILPLVGLRAFEEPKAVAVPDVRSTETGFTKSTAKGDIDTVIVPAKEEGFKRVFLGENSWYAIRIAGGMIPKIKYIAAYQSSPISAVTHLAPVSRIEPYGEEGKYKLIFSKSAEKIGPIPFGAATSGSMQGPRYTSLEKLKTAKTLAEVL